MFMDNSNPKIPNFRDSSRCENCKYVFTEKYKYGIEYICSLSGDKDCEEIVTKYSVCDNHKFKEESNE